MNSEEQAVFPSPPTREKRAEHTVRLLREGPGPPLPSQRAWKREASSPPVRWGTRVRARVQDSP